MPVTVDFSPDYETYLHRIGRCGRFGKPGIYDLSCEMSIFRHIQHFHLCFLFLFFCLGFTFNLIDSEKDFNTMKAIENYFQRPIREMTIADITNLEQDDGERSLLA